MNEETLEAAALWRRLDTRGTDAARVFRTPTGWRLAGNAVFLAQLTKSPAQLDYDVHFAGDWSTQRGRIRGFVGQRAIDQTIVRDLAGWSVNGTRVPGLAHVVDLDLGFTPATNFAQLRRIALGIGEAADFSVA